MKVIFTILLWLVVLPVKATGQRGDIIRLEGKEWVLLVKPIESDTMLGNRVRAFLPDNISYSTGNLVAIRLHGKYVTVIFAYDG